MRNGARLRGDRLTVKLLPLLGAMRNTATPRTHRNPTEVAAPLRGDEEHGPAPAEGDVLLMLLPLLGAMRNALRHGAAGMGGNVAAPLRGDEELRFCLALL